MAKNATERQADKLTPGDKERFEGQRTDLEAQLKAIQNKEVAAAEGLDATVVKQNLAKTESILNKDEELAVRGRQKDVLNRESKELEAKLKANMPTKNEMWPVRMGTPEAEAAVQKQMRFETKFGDDARRWQECQRRLQPDNPFAGSLDRIRPER